MQRESGTFAMRFCGAVTFTGQIFQGQTLVVQIFAVQDLSKQTFKGQYFVMPGQAYRGDGSWDSWP